MVNPLVDPVGGPQPLRCTGVRSYRYTRPLQGDNCAEYNMESVATARLGSDFRRGVPIILL